MRDFERAFKDGLLQIDEELARRFRPSKGARKIILWNHFSELNVRKTDQRIVHAAFENSIARQRQAFHPGSGGSELKDTRSTLQSALWPPMAAAILINRLLGYLKLLSRPINASIYNRSCCVNNDLMKCWRMMPDPTSFRFLTNTNSRREQAAFRIRSTRRYNLCFALVERVIWTSILRLCAMR